MAEHEPTLLHELTWQFTTLWQFIESRRSLTEHEENALSHQPYRSSLLEIDVRDVFEEKHVVGVEYTCSNMPSVNGVI